MTRLVCSSTAGRGKMKAFFRQILVVCVSFISAQSVEAAYSGVAVAATEDFIANRTMVPGRNEKNAEAQQLADAGRSAYLAGRYDMAVASYSALIKLMPEDSRAYYNRGNAHTRLKELDKALADFNAALKISPGLYLALMNRANIYSQKRLFTDAISDYDRAIALKPDDFLIFYNRGIAFFRSGNDVRAIGDFTEAIRLNARDAPSYTSRGNVYFQQRDFESARRDYRMAVKLDSSQTHAAQRLRELASEPSQQAAGASLDESSIKTKISNQDLVESLAQIAADACFDRGDDEQALEDFAAVSKWSAVVGDAHNRSLVADTNSVNAWLFSHATGAVTVSHSKAKGAPGRFICSMTTSLVLPGMLNDFQKAFESLFRRKLERPIEKTPGTSIRYWLIHRPTCDVNASIYFSPESGTTTVRMIHGRRLLGEN